MNRYSHFERVSVDDMSELEETGWLAPSVSMDLVNDPRFFTENVIDKRLAAFTALSVVSTLMVGAATENFYPFFDEDEEFFAAEHLIRTVCELGGFAIMCVVLFLNVLAALVFGVQFYYVYRLMTMGPIGFEGARGFYLDPDITYWRQFSARGLIWGLPMFTLSTGLMLSTKLAKKEMHAAEPWQNLICVSIFVVFAAFSLVLSCIGFKHQRLFERKYYAGAHGVRPLLSDVDQVSHSVPRRTWRH